MQDDLSSLQELSQATSLKLNLSQFAVEKDYYVTKVIHTLTSIQDDYFSLAFQGGTSLSKGYQIIHRLSEDVDFRIIQKPAAVSLGKVARRNKLRNYRRTLVHSLEEKMFDIQKTDIKVFYEGRFMSIRAKFYNADKAIYLKPHVAIECFLGELALDPTAVEITTLIKQTLGPHCSHRSQPVTCVALDETAAEKWVALTRRVAGTQLQSRQNDKHLVRHLYDLYHLKTGGYLTNNHQKIIAAIIKKDQTQFKKHNLSYAKDPISTSKMALDVLNNTSWKENWNYFLEQMVYEENKPSFDQAYEELQQLSNGIFNSLKNVMFESI